MQIKRMSTGNIIAIGLFCLLLFQPCSTTITHYTPPTKQKNPPNYISKHKKALFTSGKLRQYTENFPHYRLLPYKAYSHHQQPPFHESTQKRSGITTSVTGSSAIYWVEAGANGDGTSTNPAGNITYVLKNLVTANTFDVIQVRPGEYNNTIELFPLTISTPNVSLTSTHGASVTIINGSEITDSIRVTASNVKINGFTIKNCGGGVHGAGIFLNVTSNIRITGNTLYHNYGDGVRLGYSRNTRVTGNFLIHNSDFGIYLSESSTITITGNTISGNWYGVGLFGELYESNDIRISGNTITYQFKGIFMGGMNETTITGNTFTNNNQGIELAASYETTIMDNTITNNDWRGIRLTDASGATITGNTITNSDTGIYLWSSRGNTIMGNIITDNNNYGIWLRSSSTGNLVYRNDFLNNGVNAEDTCGGNAFNNSTIGNYWDDYTGRDVDYEGIGDTPHSIPGLEGSMDYLPSMDPFEAEERGWTELKPLVIAGPGLEYLLLSLPVTIPLVAVVIYTYKKKRE